MGRIQLSSRPLPAVAVTLQAGRSGPQSGRAFRVGATGVGAVTDVVTYASVGEADRRAAVRNVAMRPR
ncbi:hypothetical protein FBY35_0662 [Streptomyces sp. SLBN-118]|nr:hypothetical protein FBY35_0662 [Streptomyces sp. SLBN-118]